MCGNCHNNPLTFQWALCWSMNKICVAEYKTDDTSALRCVVTECCSQIFDSPASYFGGPRFKFLPDDWSA
jgi:hypothetical protein